MDERKVPLLIEEVQRRPAIWNKTLRENNNKTYVGNEWNKVAANLNVAKTCAQNKWKSLVKKFKTEHSRVQFNRSGDGLENTYESTWPYYISLLFLSNCVVGNKTSGNLDVLFEEKPVKSELSKDLINIEEKTLKSEIRDESTSPAKQLNYSDNMTSQKDNDITERFQEFIEKSVNKPTKSNAAEQDKHNMAFFETLLPTLREVSKEDILVCRTDICRVVFNYAYKGSSWNSLSECSINFAKTNSKPPSEYSGNFTKSTPKPRKRIQHDDDDCQIVGQYQTYSNVPVKLEKKYVPTAKEREIERQSYYKNDVRMQRPDSRQPLHQLHPNHQYNEQKFQPTYPEQCNYQSMDKTYWNSQSRTPRQIAGPRNHPYTITQQADRTYCPPSIMSTVSQTPNTSYTNAEHFFSGRPREIPNKEIQLDNRHNLTIHQFQQSINNENVASPAENPSIITEATPTASQTTTRGNVNDRLMYRSQDDLNRIDENRDFENFRIPISNSTNQITSNETVTRTNNSIEVDATNPNIDNTV